MLTPEKLFAAGVLAVILALPQIACGNENAAVQYMLAIFANGFVVPNCVDSATTDDPVLGFSTPLTPEQTAFLERDSTIAALARFDQASACRECEWGRFAGTCWAVGNRSPISGLHQLTRTVMLRARQRYENGDWKLANRDVENVLILARRMVTLCRQYEHQLFMIENIANGTAAAYLLRIPTDGLEDLSARLKNVGVFSPMKQLMADESTRLKSAANLKRDSEINTTQIVSILSPYFTDTDSESAFEALSPNDQTKTILELSDFLSQASEAMTVEFERAEAELGKLCEQSSSSSPYFSIGYDYLNSELRENAQGFCRGTMFRSIVGRILSGGNDFATIDDPFGDSHAVFRVSGERRILTSKLVHHNQVGFSFGDAGSK